ncbi:MAG: bifunctional oligoribonuclease/PAP phosphatase NrnA [Actinomycetota bacterium]|nr:bifunctional oligoribonuclease/PAP phosphatase NrnA [Actinomycetota bacterium]MDQ3647730.1 bifunctional oligoribonuclease/PAP phosphatase NrnA [Actinomycetota bacterium]
MSTLTEADEVVAELRQAAKLLLTTHENPDGDALGSLLAMHWVLEQIGKDSVMFMSPDEFPLPYEYRDMVFEGLVGTPPEDLDERTVVFLDCGNIDRMPVDFLRREGVHILNVDHHHDNTRFGTVNLVDPTAACTAEIVWRLAKELGAELTPLIADAMYVGLVTDTGRFSYENTSPGAHRMAAELIEAGVDPHLVYRRLYEDLPLRRLQLLQRALASVQREDHGAITLASLKRADFEETEALETDAEGIVDHMRAVEGTAVAVLVRELLGKDRRGLRKVSLRATDGRVDVSRIARAHGGGGHPQAAGFTTELSLDELVVRLRREVAAQL